jgi:DNA-binding CsgD family transcriptional regulator
MGSSFFTLLDILSSEQFQVIILLASGLETYQIADLFETSEPNVRRLICSSFDRTGCRSPEELSARLIFEKQNRLYDNRLGKELADLQRAAKKMLARTLDEYQSVQSVISLTTIRS